MRRLFLLGGIFLAGTGSVVAIGAQGCASVSCQDDENCPPTTSGDSSTDGPMSDHQLTDVRKDGKGNGDSGDGRMTDGSSDVDTGPQPCTATDTPQQNPCVITEALGIFVAPVSVGGSVTGDGSRKHPFSTFAAAIPVAVAAGKRVYACGATYAEAVSVGTTTDGVEIYGGLECPAPGDGGVADAGTIDSSTGPWSYTGAPAAVAPSATGFALDVESLTKGAHFEDMSFESMSATMTAYGTSSIAVMVNASASVAFVRVQATAGDGAPGAPGGAVATSNHCVSSIAGSATLTSGGGAGGYCSDTVTNGNCPVYGSSAGGVGGGGGTPGLVGGNGSSTPATTLMVIPYDGIGQAGASSSDSFTCGNGHPGANGSAQVGGVAGVAGSLGSSGWGTTMAGMGMPGNPGEGGGGGGGEYGTGSVGGAGGGAGGCGGNGGPGGAGGGASIAVAVVNSSVRFTRVSLHTGTGGGGGLGGQGEQGQAGGAPGLEVGCNGGVGGQGAGGSGGGGGAGGPSVGIAWTPSGMPPSVDGTVVTTTQTTLSSPSKFAGGSAGSGAGTGGLAGLAAPGDPANAGQAGNKGSDGPNGAAAAVQGF